MKHLYKKTLILSGVVFTGILSLNYSTGPGNGGLSVSGAPYGTFGAGTYCNNCHSGGSWGAAISLQLLSGAVPVTSYVPGASYTVQITRSASSATYNASATSGFGFQISCATTPANADVNTWGATLPANTANRLANSHHHIEHTQKLSKLITTESIPWTAPTGNQGSLKFYLALNTVDGNGGSSNDQPLATSLSVTQSPLAITWLSFTAKENQGSVQLEWTTSNELNNDFFTLEKSSDGEHFETLATVQAKKGTEESNSYSFMDTRPYSSNYYRVKQTDLNGNSSYFRTIQVKGPANTAQVLQYLVNDRIMVQIPSEQEKFVTVSLHSIEGRLISSRSILLNGGANIISLEKPGQSGIYITTIRDKNESVYSGKILVL